MTKGRAEELEAKYSDSMSKNEGVEMHLVYLAVNHEYDHVAIILTTKGDVGRYPVAVYTDADYFERVREHSNGKRQERMVVETKS